MVFFKGQFSKNIDKKNTVTHLLKLLDEKNFLNNKKFEIKITKNIPQESGMGGGSMNAASLLSFFINQKLLKIKKDELTKLACKIGSDVILGIKPMNTVLSSNGGIKKYKKNIKLYTLVVKANFGCSTKNIYSQVKSFSKVQFNSSKKKMFEINYLKTLNNDLEKIAFKKHPKLRRIKSFLLSNPDNIFVRMSGSGSSIVSYFHSKSKCGIAYKKFKRKFSSHWCITSKTI